MEERKRTAVDAGEEYLFDVGLWPGHGIDMKFILVRLSRPLPSFDLIWTILTGGLALFGDLGVCPLGFGLSAGAEGWYELDTVFIESQCMAEVHNGIVRAGEWQVFWNQPDRLHGVPTWGYETGD